MTDDLDRHDPLSVTSGGASGQGQRPPGKKDDDKDPATAADNEIARLRKINKRLLEENKVLATENDTLHDENFDWRRKNDALEEDLRIMTEKYNALVKSSEAEIAGKQTDNPALT